MITPNKLFENTTLSPSVGKYFSVIENQVFLCSDGVRVNAFRRAINKVVKKGDLVADIGAGTGILSELALQAGAEHVVLIEQNKDILEIARDRIGRTFSTNNFTILSGRSQELDYGNWLGQFDVVISETLGTIGFNEGITDILGHAVKNLLRPGGVAIPGNLSVFAHATQIGEFRYKRTLPFVSRKRLKAKSLIGKKRQLFAADFMEPEARSKVKKVEIELCLPKGADSIVIWFEAKLAPSILIGGHPTKRPNSFGYLVVPVTYLNERKNIKIEMFDSKSKDGIDGCQLIFKDTGYQLDKTNGINIFQPYN